MASPRAGGGVYWYRTRESGETSQAIEISPESDTLEPIPFGNHPHMQIVDVILSIHRAIEKTTETRLELVRSVEKNHAA